MFICKVMRNIKDIFLLLNQNKPYNSFAGVVSGERDDDHYSPPSHIYGSNIVRRGTLNLR